MTEFNLDTRGATARNVPGLSHGDGDDTPPAPEDGGDDDEPDRIQVTFTGKAAKDILDASRQLGINPGEFVRKSVKLGRLSLYAHALGLDDFRFETYFSEDELYGKVLGDD